MSEMNDEAVDVLIVGAGPVGSTLASELHRWGVSFRIIDRKNEPERYSKACNLWQRTQEVFSAIGLLDRLLALSTPLHTFSLHAYDELLDHIPMDAQPSPHPVPAFIGQGEIEKVLWAHLDEVGRPVERGTAITGLAEHADGVTAEIEGRDGTKRVVKARYAAACDGSKSRTRDLAGLGFEPELINKDRLLRQVDAKLFRWGRTIRPGHASFFIHDSGYLGALPLPKDLYRFFLVTDVADAPDDDRDPTLDEMQEAIRRIAGDPDVTLADPDWFSHGRYPHGVAPRYRSEGGRVFLLGDAGHVTIPIYGQGMNTGMQDAFNLGWKLAMALRGDGAPTLLDSYARERQPLRQALDDEQVRLWRFMTESHIGQRTAVRWAGAKLMSLGLERYVGTRTSELALGYSESPLNLDELRGGEVKAGDRAPDAPVMLLPDHRSTSLFEETYRTGWTLLLFDGGDQGSHGALDEVSAEVERLGCALRVLPVCAVRRAKSAQPMLLDLDRFAHSAYDLDKPALVLIRPDGHVAVRLPASGSRKLRAYLAERFVPHEEPLR